MHLHKVQNPPIKPLKGLAVVVGLIAVIVAANLLSQLAAPLIGNVPAAIAFYGFGVLAALWTMRRYILKYTYLLENNILHITFAYGRYERSMADIYLNNILNAGSLEDMRARYPSARVSKATRPACPTPALAIACKDGGSPAIYLLQPDEVIREKLEEVARKNRK